MNSKNLLKNYHLRLTVEAVIKSIIFALIIGSAVSLVVATFTFIARFNGLWLSIGLGLGVALHVIPLFYFKVFRPNAKTIAKRVDTVGLEERVITMVDLENASSFIVEKQRENTKEILKSIKSKQVHFHIPSVFFMTMAVMIILAAVMTTLSSFNAVTADTTPVLPPYTEEEEKSEEDKAIEEAIEKIREIIEEANISESLRDKLNQMVDDLEASLNKNDSLLTKLAKVAETNKKIQELIDKELAKKDIAETLQEYETTEELGKAIESGDPDQVDDAFDMMRDKIKELAGAQKVEELLQTADDIEQALEDAEDTDPALAEALQKLADEFRAAVEIIITGGDEEDVDDRLDMAFEEAKEAIKEQMEQQSNAADLGEQIDDIVDELLESVGGEEMAKDNESEGNTEDGETGDEEPVDPDDPNDTKPPKAEDGTILDSEPVLDGSTPYLEIYEEYIREAYELLESGTLTDAERKLIEKYIAILLPQLN